MPKTKEHEVIDCFATDETVTRKLLPTRFWVEIKRQLDAGEQADLDEAAQMTLEIADLEKIATSERTFRFPLSKHRFLKMASFIADWNLCDAAGKTVRLPSSLGERVGVMRRLSPRMSGLIVAAIDEIAAEALKELEADPEDMANPTPAGSDAG